MFRHLSTIVIFLLLIANSGKAFAETDIIHGVKVTDPNRWMEKPSQKLEEWKNEQEAKYQNAIGSNPIIDTIFEKLKFSLKGVSRSSPSNCVNRFLQLINPGNLEKSQIWLTQDIITPGKLILDPQQTLKDSNLSIDYYSPNKSCTQLAVSISKSGGDWQTIRVFDINSGTFLKDEINWVKFSGINWTNDGRGFYYSRYPAPEEGKTLTGGNQDHKVYYHVIGTDQKNDQLIYQDLQHPNYTHNVSTIKTSDYEILSISNGAGNVGNKLAIRKNPSDKFRFLNLGGEDSNPYAIKIVGDVLYYFTDNQAPKRKVMKINLLSPTAIPETVVPEAEMIEAVSITDNYIVVLRLVDVINKVEIYDFKGQRFKDIKLPGIGNVGIGNPFAKGDKLSLFFESIHIPLTRYILDVTSGKLESYYTSNKYDNPDLYATEQVFVRSEDGVKIPMFVSYKIGLERNGSNPTLLTGYGSFGSVSNPTYSVSKHMLMSQGFVLATCNLRGGGEYGENWHKAGQGLNSKNRFADFISCAKYLQTNKYTNPMRLAIIGGSSGGLLVSTAVNMRPDLFGAVISDVPVTDMLRFHLFSGGELWKPEYGDINKKDHFLNLLSYSPLHNVKKGSIYPPYLIITGDNDNRVAPLHSFKLTKTLQDNGSNTLLLVQKNAGHGGGANRFANIRIIAEKYGFLFKVFGLQPKF